MQVMLSLCDTLITICDRFRTVYRNIYVFIFIYYAQIFRVKSDIIDASISIMNEKDDVISYNVTSIVMCFYYFEHNYSTFKLQNWLDKWTGIKPQMIDITHYSYSGIIQKTIDLEEDKWMVYRLKSDDTEFVDIPDSGNIALSNL